MANYSSDHNPNKCIHNGTLETGSPTMSAVMFSTGAAGNIIALVLLDLRRRRRGSSLFQILLTALVVTDLLGTVSVSPIVLASYAWNRTLLSMGSGGEVCKYFGFSMTFFSLSTLSVLCAMAIERCVSIGSPYFYERHFNCNKHCGHIALALIYVACFLFCVCPFAGFGSCYVQYCPGTWCFLNMHPLSDRKAKVFTGLYASFTLILISGTVGCNVSVMYCLVKMHRRHSAQRHRGPQQQQPGGIRRRSLSEEVEHLLLMSFITVVFILCSSPIVLRVYINLCKMEEEHAYDLPALRLLSLNSIINPWVFIILRPSVQRFIWRKLMPRPHKSKLSPGMALTVQPTAATKGLPEPLLNQAGE